MKRNRPSVEVLTAVPRSRISDRLRSSTVPVAVPVAPSDEDADDDEVVCTGVGQNNAVSEPPPQVPPTVEIVELGTGDAAILAQDIMNRPQCQKSNELLRRSANELCQTQGREHVVGAGTEALALMLEVMEEDEAILAQENSQQ